MTERTLDSSFRYSREGFDAQTPSMKITRLIFFYQSAVSFVIIETTPSFDTFYEANSAIIISVSFSATSDLVIACKQKPRLSPNFFM
jgi:hypothetical protein